jgi:hypothetical protein
MLPERNGVRGLRAMRMSPDVRPDFHETLCG